VGRMIPVWMSAATLQKFAGRIGDDLWSYRGLHAAAEGSRIDFKATPAAPVSHSKRHGGRQEKMEPLAKPGYAYCTPLPKSSPHLEVRF